MPFFLSLGAARCTGRGEVLSRVGALPGDEAVTIVKLPVGLSTPRVFQAMDYGLLSPADPGLLLASFLESGAAAPGGSYVNDLEEPAFRLLPELKDLRDRIVATGRFRVVRMSGSGTSLFCVGEGGGGSGWEDVRAMEGLEVWEGVKFLSRESDDVWYEDPN